MIYSKFTVLFEEPFWIGLYECQYDGKYMVCKIIFGAEPKDEEILHFMDKNFKDLKFSPAIEVKKASKSHTNPKRIQRDINKQLHQTGIGTKAQQALKLQHEQRKADIKAHKKEKKTYNDQMKFQKNQVKKKEKHKGH